MAREHGKASTYIKAGCRCDLCRLANRRACAQAQARRVARLAAGTAAVVHGKASTYEHWGCRCEPCGAAERVKQQASYRARRGRSQ